MYKGQWNLLRQHATSVYNQCRHTDSLIVLGHLIYQHQYKGYIKQIEILKILFTFVFIVSAKGIIFNSKWWHWQTTCSTKNYTYTQKPKHRHKYPVTNVFDFLLKIYGKLANVWYQNVQQCLFCILHAQGQMP